MKVRSGSSFRLHHTAGAGHPTGARRKVPRFFSHCAGQRAAGSLPPPSHSFGNVPVQRQSHCPKSGCAIKGRLFRDANKQGTGQFAVCTNEGCVVGFIALAHNSRGPSIRLFLRQRFVGRTIVVKLCADGGLSVLRQGSLGSHEVRTIIGKDRFPPMPRRWQAP
jgi:hypothetical protein